MAPRRSVSSASAQASGALDQAHRFVATRLIDVGNDDAGACYGKTSRYGATASGAACSSDDNYARVVWWSRHVPTSSL